VASKVATEAFLSSFYERSRMFNKKRFIDGEYKLMTKNEVLAIIESNDNFLEFEESYLIRHGNPIHELAGPGESTSAKK
jgi:hypothetical protein